MLERIDTGPAMGKDNGLSVRFFVVASRESLFANVRVQQYCSANGQGWRIPECLNLCRFALALELKVVVQWCCSANGQEQRTNPCRNLAKTPAKTSAKQSSLPTIFEEQFKDEWIHLICFNGSLKRAVGSEVAAVPHSGFTVGRVYICSV